MEDERKRTPMGTSGNPWVTEMADYRRQMVADSTVISREAMWFICHFYFLFDYENISDIT